VVLDGLAVAPLIYKGTLLDNHLSEASHARNPSLSFSG